LRRPAVLAALLYMALAILFVSPGLLPGKTLSNSDTLWFETPWVSAKPAALKVPSNPDLGDAAQQLQPFLRRTVTEMPHVPLWNPTIDSGRPFLANSQSGVFSLFTLPAYLLPFWTALGWIAVLKLWLAGFGTYLLGRALDMRFAAALLAGIAFAFSLRMTSWLIYPTMGIWALIPWMLLLTDRLVRRPSVLTGAALAVVVALQFLAGHPETSFHALLATGAFLLLSIGRARRAGLLRDRAAMVRPVLGFGAAVAGGTALAALNLLPLLELVWHSADRHARAGVSIDRHLPGEDWISVFLPDYWGRPTQTPVRRLTLESAMYVGALPLMLAAVGLVVRATATRVAVALFGALWLAVLLGVPPFLQVVTRLPLFSSGHNTRLIALSVLALALLAGWGMDDLLDRTVPARHRARALAVAAALVLVPVVVVAVWRDTGPGALPEALRIAWLFADPPGQYRDVQGVAAIALSSLIVWLTFAGAALVLIVLRVRGRLGPRAFAALALLVAVADLFRAGVGFNPAIDRRYASVPATGAIRYLERRRPARFVSTDDVPVNVIPMSFGLDEARGYDLPIVERYDRLWRSQVQPGTSVAAGLFEVPLRVGAFTPSALRTLRLLGVRNVLGAKSVWPASPPFDRPTPVAPLRVPGLRTVYDGPDARVYRLAGALPRAWVVGAQQVAAGGDAALRAVSDPRFDPRATAVTERRLPGLPNGAGPPGSAGTAALVHAGDERVVVRASARRPALLVVGDVQFPGWKARVDGRDAHVERVDYALRGVRIGPGTHTVELRYEPLSWRVGLATSAVAVAGLAVCLAIGIGRRRSVARST
jgi:hypothetical protein